MEKNRVVLVILVLIALLLMVLRSRHYTSTGELFTEVPYAMQNEISEDFFD